MEEFEINKINEELAEINRISEKIAEIDEKIKELEERKKERKEQTDIGVISIVGESLKIELLMNKDLFTQEHLDRLKQIANELQNLLIEVIENMEAK